MKRMEKEKKRAAKKEKILADKSELRKKMSVIATTTLDNDEDLLMSRKLWDDVRRKGFEGVGDKSDNDDSSEEEKGQDENSEFSDEEEDSEGEKDSSDDEIDEKQAHISAMADQMEEALSRQKEYQMSVDRKMAGKEARKKALIEQQRLRLEDLEEKEALDNAGLLDDSDSDAEGKEEGDKVQEGRDIESSGESDDENAGQKSLFVNPLAKLSARNKADGKESEEWSDDNLSDAPGQSKSKKGKKKDTVLGKRKRKGSIDDVQDFFNTGAIEEVPANDPGTLA